MKYKFSFRYRGIINIECPYYVLMIESRNNIGVVKNVSKRYTLMYRSSKSEIETIISTNSKYELKITMDLLGLRSIKPLEIISTKFGSFIRGYYKR